MKLKATSSFGGMLGSAGVGQTFEVDEKTGKKMLKEGYPVVEVKSGGRKRDESVKPDNGNDS